MSRILWMILGLSSLSGSVSQTERWKLEPIDYALSNDDKIGTLKAGFLCVPSGTLRWNDIKLPRDYELSEKAVVQVNNILKARDLTSPEIYQLKGRINKFELKLCVSGLGFGEKRPKGEGKMEIRWTKLHLSEGTEIRSETVQTTFIIDGLDPRKDAEPLQQAIIQNLAKFLAVK
jgi:hypothetical protein